MNISPAQLWYMTHVQPILVTEKQALESYVLYRRRPFTALSLESYAKAVSLLEQSCSMEGPKELASFLKVLDNSLQEEVHNTLLLTKLEELRGFLSSTCALSTSLTVATRKEGDKLIHEFVISAKN